MGLLIAASSITLTSCTKEGPQGIAGTNGTNGKDGTNGTDGTAGCVTCHKADGIELMATQFEFSKHSYGEAAFEESGNTGCTPCHASEAFKYVCENNVPSTFTLNTTTNKWVNDYATISSAAYGEITCSTCHSTLHTTYSAGDLALTTVAPVSMTMWAGAKTINLSQKGGESNLCVKCHQPRPFTNSATDGHVLDYVGLATNPTAVFYDPAGTTNVLKPGYRTHTHYGTAGAVFAGMGGVEFNAGTAYLNSAHTTAASCQDCHMAAINGRSGGHTFNATNNFSGCNQTDCHADLNSSSTLWTATRADIKADLDALAAKLVEGGIDILNRNPDASTNLWAGITTNNYDGYLNIYDPINNPSGPTNNSVQFQNPSTNGFTQAQKDINAGLQKITLTNAQMGSIINFQLCLRDYSLGIHNYKYTKALLSNSIAVNN
jgi:hypothetical protein